MLSLSYYTPPLHREFYGTLAECLEELEQARQLHEAAVAKEREAFPADLLAHFNL